MQALRLFATRTNARTKPPRFTFIRTKRHERAQENLRTRAYAHASDWMIFSGSGGCAKRVISVTHAGKEAQRLELQRFSGSGQR